jgi:hypothetical protein
MILAKLYVNSYYFPYLAALYMLQEHAHIQNSNKKNTSL